MATATVANPNAKQAATRIASLDGWRGIAILLVLFDHIQGAFFHRYPWMQTGQHGVTLFFVLSGFLITRKLMEKPSLRSFYIRRFFRLMPAAWAYLIFVALVRASHWRDALACIFFFRNYTTGDLMTGHFWSLSIEEQFYLFWPCVLLLAGVRRARWIAISVALLCAFYRFMMWHAYDRVWVSFHTEVRVDALLIGCLLALVFTRVRGACMHLAIPALFVFVFCIARYHWLPPLYEDIAIAVLLGASTANPESMMARLTAFSPLAWLGIVSYSIYVWQQYFFFSHIGTRLTPVMIVLMPLPALGSYFLIERPCIRLGYRIAHTKYSYSNLVETTQSPIS